MSYEKSPNDVSKNKCIFSALKKNDLQISYALIGAKTRKLAI